MLTKIKQFFGKFKKKQENWMSGMKFRESIKALGMEVYKDITVVYLSKPGVGLADPLKLQPVYHFFYKKQFYGKEAETYEALVELAHKDIDELK